jgi:hypothetical protein
MPGLVELWFWGYVGGECIVAGDQSLLCLLNRPQQVRFV